MNELNRVLNSTSFQGHNSIMIVYQIWKQCRSFTNLRKLVASQYSFAKEITSLEEIHDLYGKEVCCSHLLYDSSDKSLLTGKAL